MKRLPLLFLLAALLAAGCSSTQEAAAPDESPAAPEPEARDIRVSEYAVEDLTFPELRSVELPEIETVELDNGLKIYLIEDHELPQISATARIGTGAVYEPAEKLGLASVTGSVMRTGGTQSMTADELNQALEDLGATVETSIGETSGSAYMNTLSDHIDTVLPLFAEVLRAPAFAEDKIELAKTQQRTAISRRNDNPQQIASREFAKLIYGAESPYARHPEYYTIDRIERQDLVDFHEAYFHPNNTYLSVWGNFDSEEMKEKLRSAFANWERAEGFETPTPPTPDAERSASVNFVQKDDVTQSTIFIGHPGELTRRSPDYPTVTVMNEVLSGGFSGRLFRNVRDDQGLAYSVFGQYSAGYDRPGQFFSGVFTRSAATVEAAQAVLHEIERMREAAPTDEELQLAKDSYLNSFVFNFDSRREILSRIMTYDYYDYPRDFLEQVRDGIEEADTDDVLRVSQEYLYPDEADILVVGRQQDFEEPLETLAEDGTVNEIDITIPTNPPGAEEEAPASAEDMAGGQEKLMAVREALGGSAFDEVENLRETNRQTAQTPQGEQSVESTTVIELPDRFHAEMTLPNGMQLTVVDDGEEMMLNTPQGAQPAPPPVREQIASELWRSLPYLMARAEAVEPEDRGTIEVDGTTYEALRISPPQGNAFTLLLDPETMRPARMQFEGTNPQTGAPFEGTNVYNDYREVSGLLVPFETVTYQGSEQQSTSTIQSLEVNTSLEEDLFSVQ